MICYHRSAGFEENTIPALIQVLRHSPYLLEFDIQPHKDDFYLGHPPHKTHYTLREVLSVFTDYHTLPKVDLKFTSAAIAKDQATITKLIIILSDPIFDTIPRFLVNISGLGEAKDFMDREHFFHQTTDSSRILLNIDLVRYKGVPKAQIYAHIRTIKKSVFSISPEITTADLNAVKNCCRIANVNNVHFWLRDNYRVSIEKLEELKEWREKNHLIIYFDISLHHIIAHEAVGVEFYTSK